MDEEIAEVILTVLEMFLGESEGPKDGLLLCCFSLKAGDLGQPLRWIVTLDSFQ